MSPTDEQIKAVARAISVAACDPEGEVLESDMEAAVAAWPVVFGYALEAAANRLDELASFRLGTKEIWRDAASVIRGMQKAGKP